MAKKSEEIIKKPVATRGRPRKDSSASTTKKASKSKTKKKTTKKSSSSKKSVNKKTKSSTKTKKIENVEIINDVQIESTIEQTANSETLLENNTLENIVVEPEIVNQEESIKNEIVEVCPTDVVEEITEIVEDKEQHILENQEQEIVPEVSVEQPIDVAPKAKKRTIRNISIKRPSAKASEEIIEDKPAIQEEQLENISSNEEELVEDISVQAEQSPIEEKIIVLPKKEKRTLRLNLGSRQKQEEQASPSYKKDESINQNSAFFNEPSIFAKFNIDIINTEAEEIPEESNQQVEPTSTSEEVNLTNVEQNNQKQELPIETEVSEEIVSVESIDEQLDELITEALTQELENTEEPSNEVIEKEFATSLSDEEIEKAILEEISETISEETIENEIENSEILNSVRSILGGKLGSLEEISSEVHDNDTAIENETIENEIEIVEDTSIPENIINFENNIENDVVENEILETAQEEIELKEVADTIKVEEPVQEKTFDNSPIGKFFDSSIPSMTSTVNNTFSKIKKSIFSNISPIFKKFTFEEATFRTHSNDIENNYVEQENNLSDIQKALENFTPNAQVVTNITEMDIQAEPVISIPTIEVDTLLSTEQENISYDMPELNIITPEAESSFETSDDLEDDVIELENEETAIVEEVAEDIQEVQNTSLENNDDEYNDEDFSIEAYFGLDDVTLDEEDEINTEIPEENEISEEIEDTASTPEEFVDKFFEENKEIEDSEEFDELQTNDDEELVDEESIEDDLVNEEISEATEVSVVPNELEQTLKEKELEISNLSKLLESFTQTISTLTNRITDLENKQLAEKETEIIEEVSEESENIVEELIENASEETDEIVESDEEINLDDIDINDLDITDLDLNDLDINEDSVPEVEEPSLLSPEENSEEENQSVESILSEVFLSKELDASLKDELLSEVLSYEETLSEEDSNLDDLLLEEALLDELSDEDLTNLQPDTTPEVQEPLSDFSKIIDSLTKAITELEQTPDIKQEVEKKNVVTPLAPLPAELTNYTTSESEEKAINILINKDDIFSISILNETYEIVADFDGISVLSENLHISTPKNNFFVRVGNKYIEIHNKKDHFVLNTNFEDIEFANAINNIAFAKKNNKIELNIKEAFKLTSVNNKIELSMLNKAIADLSSSSQTSENKDESSICDNKTLLISEETQKVYLPYTIEDVMKKLKSGEDYQTVQEVVDKEYTLPLSTFKMPIISRFKEAYRFMRTKENSSVYAAVDLALELMFNSNLNPAVIRAAKDLKELNIYLDCLYENEIEKFDCFKIVYKVLPKIK